MFPGQRQEESSRPCYQRRLVSPILPLFKAPILTSKYHSARRNWNWKEKHYLISDTPGSRITFKLTTTVGNIEIHYLRSYQYNLGSVKCWIDEDVDKAMRLDGYWKEPYNIGR